MRTPLLDKSKSEMLHQVDEVISRIKMNRFHYLILLPVCGLAFCVDAMEVVLLSFVSSCAGKEFDLDDSRMASITSCVFFGALLGSLFWGPVADQLGRRRSYLLSMTVVLIGAWSSGVAPNFGWLLALRFVVGFGVGGSTVPFDTFAEFLPAENRGQYLMMVNAFWSCGGVFVVLSAKYVIPVGGWRALVFVAATPVTICALSAMYFLPESPRWLISKGRYAEAEAICLQAMKHSDCQFPFKFGPRSVRSKNTLGDTGIGIDDAAASTVFDGNQKLYTDDSQPALTSTSSTSAAGSQREPGQGQMQVGTGTGMSMGANIWENLLYTLAQYREIVFGADMCRVTCRIGLIWLMFGFTYYGVILLVTRLNETSSSSSGSDDSSACSFDYEAILVNTSAEFLGLFGAMLTIERWGRRGTQSLWYVLGALALIIMGTLHSSGKSLISILGYIGRMAAMGSSCVTWVVTPELYPTRVRATAHSFLNAVARVGAFVSPYVVVSHLSVLSVAVALGTCNAFAAIAAYSLRETAGVGLDAAAAEGFGEEDSTENPM